MAKKIDTKRLAEELNTYISDRDRLKAEGLTGDDLPRVPEFVGECIVSIATRFAWNYKWSRIPSKDKDDMISAGVMATLKGIENSYDPSKSKTKSPMSFIMTCCNFAYLTAVTKSKRYFDGNNRLLGSYMDGQVQLDSTQPDLSVHIESLKPIRNMLDNYDRDVIKDESLDYAGKYKQKERERIFAEKQAEKQAENQDSSTTEKELPTLDIF